MALTAVTAFFACTQVATVAASVAGLRFGTSTAWAVVVVSVACAAGLGWAQGRHTGGDPGDLADLSRETAGGVWTTGVAVAAAATLGWATSLWGRLWLLALQRPPYDWDGLYYHLPAINAWTLRGAIGFIDDIPDVPFVNYPAGAEAFTFLAHYLLPTAPLASALDLWYWPLGVLAVVVIAREVGALGPWPWLAGGLLAGVPVVVSQSVTAYVDIAFACATMGALAAALICMRCRDDVPWPSAALFGMSLGLMAGIKGTGAPFALVLFAGVGVAAVIRRHGLPPARVGRTLGVAAAVAVVVGGHWYVRNAVHTANPLFPVGLRLGQLVVWDGYDAVDLVERNLPERLQHVPSPLRAPAAWLQGDAPIQGAAPTGGLGYIWLFFGVPASLAAAALAVGRGRAHVVTQSAYVALLVLVAVLFVVTPAHWWSRLTIWLHALGLPAIALCLQWLLRDGAWVRRAAGVAVLLASVGVSVWEAERTLDLEWRQGLLPRTATVTGDAYRSTIDSLFPGLATSSGFDRALTETRVARSPWGRFGVLLGGALAVPFGARELLAIPGTPSLADLDRARARGARWLIWDEAAAGPVPPVVSAQAAEAHVWSHGSGQIFHAIRLVDPR